MELATCEKYYDKVLERFPELSKKQVDKIIKRGLRSLYMYNLYGADVLLKHPKYVMYFGKLFNDGLVFTKYALIKWRIKLRIIYKRQKRKYDGYYYFGVSNKTFKELDFVDNKRRKHLYFKGIKLYKILDECLIDKRFDHFFKVAYPEDCGFTMWKKDYTLKNVEYVYKRNPDKSIEPVSYERNRDKCVKRRVK